MNTERRVIWLTVSVILGVIVLSGPLVGAVDLTPAQTTPSLTANTAETDSLNVTVVDVPLTVQLKHTDYGSDAYELRVPPATVQINTVQGNPLLFYRLSIPALGFSTSWLHAPAEHIGEQLALSMKPHIFAPEDIERQEYDGTLTIVARVNGSEERITTRNMTVTVTE